MVNFSKLNLNELRRGFADDRLLVLRVRIPPGHGYLCLVSVVCCQVGLSATGWSLARKSATECVREASALRRPWPLGSVTPWGGWEVE